MALWHFLPIPAAKMSLAIQLSALALLTANLFIVRKIALLISNGSQTIALTAVIFTAFYLPLNNWSLQGMEVAAITPLVSSGGSALAEHPQNRPLLSRHLYPPRHRHTDPP